MIPSMLSIVLCLFARNRANRQGSPSCPSSSIHLDQQWVCEATSCCVALPIQSLMFDFNWDVKSTPFDSFFFSSLSRPCSAWRRRDPACVNEGERERGDVITIGWWWFALYDWSGWEAHQSRRRREVSDCSSSRKISRVGSVFFHYL